MPNRQEVQAEEAEQNEERAERAGDNGTRDVELEIDEKAAKDKEQNGNVGVGQLAEKTLTDGRHRGDDLRSLQVQRKGCPVETMDLAAIERIDQRRVVG